MSTFLGGLGVHGFGFRSRDGFSYPAPTELWYRTQSTGIMQGIRAGFKVKNYHRADGVDGVFIAASHDGRIAVGANGGSTVRVFDAGMKTLHSAAGSYLTTAGLAFDASGNLFAVGDTGDGAIIYRFDTNYNRTTWFDGSGTNMHFISQCVVDSAGSAIYGILSDFAFPPPIPLYHGLVQITPGGVAWQWHATSPTSSARHIPGDLCISADDRLFVFVFNNPTNDNVWPGGITNVGRIGVFEVSGGSTVNHIAQVDAIDSTPLAIITGREVGGPAVYVCGHRDPVGNRLPVVWRLDAGLGVQGSIELPDPPVAFDRAWAVRTSGFAGVTDWVYAATTDAIYRLTPDLMSHTKYVHSTGKPQPGGMAVMLGDRFKQ